MSENNTKLNLLFLSKKIILSPSLEIEFSVLDVSSVDKFDIICNSINIIRNAADHSNNGRVPVTTFDQPLFTIAKEIQWKWIEIYGEEKFVVMLCSLHIEKSTLSIVRDCPKGSGCTSALV